ncbi:MAG: M48 family metalloprotease [Planctomycetes bacterium]|nr:M48 family metalloprotease [Planctomycetota bacterium]
MKRRRIAILCLLVALVGAAGCRINPVTGQNQLMLFGEDEEIALGHQCHPNVIYMYDGEYYDPDLNSYLGSIVTRLHECSHRPYLPVEFTMLNTSIINAFALPAHVYATRGFLARLENEAQFAAVMGHELGHVSAGHTAKRLTNNVLVSLGFTLVGSAAGESAQAARLATTAGQAGITLLGLSYSREQERQADRLGAYYMALAGWDPAQAVGMQELLHSFNEREPSALDNYLSTHPPKDDRIREIRAVIQEKSLSGRYMQGDGVYAGRWNRRLRRLRAVDEAFKPYDRGMKLLRERKCDQALGAAREALAIRNDQAQFFRLEGDALLGLGRLEKAREAYRAALDCDNRYAPAKLGLGRALEESGDRAAAERQFEEVVHDWPGGPQGYLELGLVRMRQGEYAEAIPALSKVAQAAPAAGPVHYDLALCYDRIGQAALAYESYERALGAGIGAEERLRAALRVEALKAELRFSE